MKISAVCLVLLTSGVVAGCGGDDSTSARDVTCEQREQETEARQSLQSELETAYVEKVQEAWGDTKLDGEFLEEAKANVANLLDAKCQTEAADFKPYEYVMDRAEQVGQQ